MKLYETKLVKDLFTDGDGCWDTVRIMGFFALAGGLSATIYAMWKDVELAKNITNYGLGIAGQLGAYAGSVVGHSFAKN